ncbi:MAG: hypothetical protein CMO57_01485 [Verrucomicrobiales bacterium]|nr:hypothetical protein [Verrucomicrobiales bacterium]|tara:strand:+ start:2088 stop:2606 length:519 start_codon:yes stop_codon:yes gene_type:complete
MDSKEQQSIIDDLKLKLRLQKEDIDELKNKVEYIMTCGLFDIERMNAWDRGEKMPPEIPADQQQPVLNEDLAEVISFKVKPQPIEVNSDRVFIQKFSFIVEIKNNSSNTIGYGLDVIWEDGDGFELDNQIGIPNGQLRPNETVKESGIATTTIRDAGTGYKEINCKINAFPI